MDLEYLRALLNAQLRKVTYRSVLTASFLAAVWSAGLYFTSHSDTTLGQAGVLSVPELSVHYDAFPVKVPTMRWGMATDTLDLVEGQIERGQYLADLLIGQGLKYAQVDQLVSASKGIFDFRQFREGKKYAFLRQHGQVQPRYFIYEPNVYEYLVFDLKDKMNVERVTNPVETSIKTASGVVDGSLWNTMVSNGLSFELAAKMEDALQWSVDFHHMQQGDVFKAVYAEKSIDGQIVGVDAVKAAYYKTGESEFQAFYFDNGKESGYYDSEGRPLNSSFLKAPVKAARISSFYNLNRFHPILKRRRPHFGTDYAAPYGTPIIAVGNGVVTKASRTRGNGNFVKIRHDDTYETQYLHMQKFAKGIKPGIQVKQGQVIGYVGSTGLATGPHVCFRFWKNGQQINHLKLTFPPSKSLDDKYLAEFFQQRDALLDLLKAEHPQLVETDKPL